MKLYFVFLTFLLFGCGHASESPSGSHLALEIELPAGLRRDARLQNFNQRVVTATVRFELKGGQVIEQTLAPGQWDNIPVPQFDFPRQPHDVLDVTVRIWDRNRDGFPRSFPVLSGHAHIKAEEMGQGLNSLPVRLSLAVSVADYD